MSIELHKNLKSKVQSQVLESVFHQKCLSPEDILEKEPNQNVKKPNQNKKPLLWFTFTSMLALPFLYQSTLMCKSLFIFLQIGNLILPNKFLLWREALQEFP